MLSELPIDSSRREMRREDNRNIKVRAESELNNFPNKKSKKKSVKEKHGVSMNVTQPDKAKCDERKLFK